MITIPDVKYLKSKPKPIDDDSYITTSGGASNLLRRSDTRWIVELKTVLLSYKERIEFDGWVAQLDNGFGETVLFSDPRKRYPNNHFVNKAPAETNGSISTVTELNEITISSVSSDLNLTSGDYLGFEYNGNYHFAHVISSVGTGTERDLKFRPPLPHDMGVPGVTVRFVDCKIPMSLMPDSYVAADDVLSSVSLTLYEAR